MADEVRRIGRKLLVASLGVATVSYAACGGSASPSTDAARDGALADQISATPDAGADAGNPFGPVPDASPDRQFIGNLI